MVLSLRAIDEELSDADMEALNAAVKLVGEINHSFKRMEESMRNQIVTTKTQMQQLEKMADIVEKKFGYTQRLAPLTPQSEIQINLSENSSSELYESVKEANESMKSFSCLNPLLVNVDRVITKLEVSQVDSCSILCIENEVTVESEVIDETLEFETSLDVMSSNFNFRIPTVLKNDCESFYFGLTSLLEGQFKVLWSEMELGILVLSSFRKRMLLLRMSTRFYRREAKLQIATHSFEITGICYEVFDPGIRKVLSLFCSFATKRGSEPVLQPSRLKNRTLLRKGQNVFQVLVQWQGQAPEDATWENKNQFAKDYPTIDLEDVVLSDGEGTDAGQRQPIVTAQHKRMSNRYSAHLFTT